LTGCAAITNAILKTGPVSICTSTDNNWFSYKKGTIISSCRIKAGSGHCYLLVGVNSVEGSWKFKNSWGTVWGENGFFRARRIPTDTKIGQLA